MNLSNLPFILLLIPFGDVLIKLLFSINLNKDSCSAIKFSCGKYSSLFVLINESSKHIYFVIMFFSCYGDGELFGKLSLFLMTLIAFSSLLSQR